MTTVYQPVKRDLRKFGGPEDGSVVDGIVQEIDIATGLELLGFSNELNHPLLTLISQVWGLSGCLLKPVCRHFGINEAV